MTHIRFRRFRRLVRARPFIRWSTGLGKLAMFVVLLAHGQVGLAQVQHGLPFVNAAGSAQTGFVWIINRSSSAGTVEIGAIDDSGERFGPVDLSLDAMAAVRLNSSELEGGNSGKGLPVGIGDGEGNWRLELTTALDIDALAFIRTADGFVTAGHDIVQSEFVPASSPGGDDSILYHVSFFNPGSNTEQQSLLRLTNTSNTEVVVTIEGLDDKGQSPPGGDVSVTLAAYEAHTVTAQELEQGDTGMEGSFGDGDGKWRLFVSAVASTHGETRPIQVVNLLFGSITGNLANISSVGPGNDPNRGGDGVDYVTGGEGDDILNPGTNDDGYDVVFGSAGDDTIVYSDSGPTSYQVLNYRDLSTGINATINGVTNTARVTKGTNGTDTIVDIATPMNASKEPPYGGFGIAGSGQNDTFVLTTDDEGQGMEVRGEAGSDRIDIRSGTVVVNYRTSTLGINVDLASGRVSNDGFGGVDTIIGDVTDLVGGDGNDTLLGSAGGDRLDGGDGDDVINPKDNEYGDDIVFASAGNDRVVYTDSTVQYQELWYSRPWREARTALDEAGIVFTLDGAANTASVSKGSAGTDTIVDIANPLYAGWTIGGLGIYGTKGDDVFNLTVDREQWMQVAGGEGDDTFNLRSPRWESDSLQSGTIRIDYSHAPGGIDLDLRDRVARDDGWGDSDSFTFNDGDFEVRGSEFSDTILGSDGNDRFIGRRGNDEIDGRGGYDQLRFDRSGVQNVRVDMREGTATGVWGGSAFLDTTAWWHYGSNSERLVSNTFSYTFSNIERIRGSRNGDDEIAGSDHSDRLDGYGGDDGLYGRGGDDDLYGGDGDDTIEGGGGDDHLEGGSGGDVFLFEPGHGDDYIGDFTSGEDIIALLGFNMTKQDLLNHAWAWGEGIGIHIELTSFGGGTINLGGIHRNDFDASDFLL